MNKKTFGMMLMTFLSFLLFSGCTTINNKSTSISIIYLLTTAFSLLLLFGYLLVIKKRSLWFVVLFSSVFIVNAGYFLLSLSRTLDNALWANRISYLGSVFLPLSMIMIVFDVTKTKYKKWVPYILFSISLIVFLVASTPGYLDIYYKSATLEKINGVSVLKKEYGPLHCINLYYLLGYFLIMSVTAIYATIKKKVENSSHSAILIVAVFVNICVWLLEQLVRIDFEFLSVSYIISELFLIGVYLMIEHQEKLIESLQAKIITPPASAVNELIKDSPEFIERCNYISEQLANLTATEYAIYNCYLEGKSTKEVLKEMNISENTLKFHNKNIYGKLGVTSRKQLMQYAKAICAASNNCK